LGRLQTDRLPAADWRFFAINGLALCLIMVSPISPSTSPVADGNLSGCLISGFMAYCESVAGPQTEAGF